jgi:hypothetical protein
MKSHTSIENNPIDQSRLSQREEAFQRIYKGVVVKTRRYHLSSYKKCFVASEAVDFMVDSGWATSREDAIRIGVELQMEFNMFEHVVDPEKHMFKDEPLFFKFNTGDMSETSTENNSTTKSLDSDDGFPQEGSDRATYLGLIVMQEILREGIPLKYNFTIDKECFTANSAVDFMVSTGLASSREDAADIGLALERQYGCLRNVKGDEKFADAKIYYGFEGNKEEGWREQLGRAREFFCVSIKVSDHMYRLKTYKDCFTGTEAVDLLLSSGITSSRQDAVLIGRAFTYEYNLFQHVANDHEFEDAAYFYRFSNLERISSRLQPN